MSTKVQSFLKSFLIFVLLIGIGVTTTVWYQGRTPTETAQAVAVLPTPTQPPEISVDSAAGDQKLTLRTTHKSDGSTEYTYSISGRVLFDKTLPKGASLELPLNSWDPTDTYVFLEEHTSGAVDYFVLKTDGTPFADGSHSIDVGAVWANNNMGYTIRTATGWASGTLLILYTSNTDGSKGPAFWFEIPDKAIIQLAS